MRTDKDGDTMTPRFTTTRRALAAPARPRTAGRRGAGVAASLAALVALAAAAGPGAGLAEAQRPRGCPQGAIDLGSWCLDDAPYAVPAADAGRADWFYATARCAERGGYLPRAEQLVGAAAKTRLASRLDDDPAGALIDADPADGLTDWREMSATLITTRGGSSAGGSLGASEQARGDPRVGEPDPVPTPAETAPDSLQYLTVVDNRDRGGFAGARPLTDVERFRCAYGQWPGDAAGVAAPTPAPAATTGQPVLTVPARQRAAGLSGGLVARIACPDGCRYRVRLEVASPRAWQVGLSRRIGRAAVLAVSGAEPEQLDAGSSVRVRLRPPAAVRRAIARIVADEALTARVHVELEAPAGSGASSTLTRPVRLVR